jgi:hypothetical protein
MSAAIDASETIHDLLINEIINSRNAPPAG